MSHSKSWSLLIQYQWFEPYYQQKYGMFQQHIGNIHLLQIDCNQVNTFIVPYTEITLAKLLNTIVFCNAEEVEHLQ